MSRRSSIIVLTTALALGAALAAVAQTPPAAQHPIGGYLPQPAGSRHLINNVWQDAVGYPLYVLDRECNGQCAVVFPPLTPPSATAKGPSADWAIRVREENGALQWVYKGHPVYTFWEDKTERAATADAPARDAEPPHGDSIIPGVRLARPEIAAATANAVRLPASTTAAFVPGGVFALPPADRYKATDADKDGKVTKSEFLAVINRDAQPFIDNIWANRDTNRDGWLTDQEMNANAGRAGAAGRGGAAAAAVAGRAGRGGAAATPGEEP